MTDTDAMVHLKASLSAIMNVIPSGSSIYYLDYPVHTNVGDLLIMKGTETFFNNYNIRVVARYSANNYPKNFVIPQGHVIVMHGGGNVGDLYPLYQRFRERIAVAHPSHRIVILPQTVYFSSKNAQRDSFSLLAKHKDLHLFVRDRDSYRKASELLRNVSLSPDMAHQLWPIKPVHSPKYKTLFHDRRDKEHAGLSSPIAFTHRKDWKELFTSYDRIKNRQYLDFLPAINPHAAADLWYRLADRYIEKAIQEYSSYETIVTSRLHGHILACLMGKPNILLNNSYGKNASYYQAWTYRVSQAILRD